MIAGWYSNYTTKRNLTTKNYRETSPLGRRYGVDSTDPPRAQTAFAVNPVRSETFSDTGHVGRRTILTHTPKVHLIAESGRRAHVAPEFLGIIGESGAILRQKAQTNSFGNFVSRSVKYGG
jgi:hypothetical protein